MSPPTEDHRAKGRVLIVDDDADFCEFVRIVLESRGYEVLEAPSAAPGLALMHEERPDLILLDAMISYELSGVQLVSTVRNDPQLAHIPLVLISAVLSEDGDRFLPAQQRHLIDRFLSKPISPDELIAVVDEYMLARGTPPKEPT